MRPHLTAPHVVGVLETGSQCTDQAILKLMILLPQLSPLLKLQVLCHHASLSSLALAKVKLSMYYTLLPSSLALPEMRPFLGQQSQLTALPRPL